MSTPVWNRSETQEKVLTVVEDGVLMDLNHALAIEYQVKTAPETADPPLIGLAIGYGVTLRAQAGDTLGQADIVVPSAAVDSLPPGYYYEEVAVDWDDSRRTYPVPARRILVRGVVNRPASTPAPLPAPASAAQDVTHRSFVWTATVDGTVQIVAIPGDGMRDTSYVVSGFVLRDPAASDGAHPDAYFPAAGRGTSSFQVITGDPIRAGSTYDVTLRDA